MTQTLSLRAGRSLLTRLGKAITRKVEMITGSREHYRPEKHYMRGPGPKSKRAATPKQE